MSLPVQDQPQPAQGAQASTSIMEPPSKPTYRSFKKKFLKMKVTFDNAMAQSDKVFKDEQKIVDIVRRLQEQNDQIADFLLDINECPRISRDHRYDLAARENTMPAPPLLVGLDDTSSPETKMQAALAALSEAQKEVQSGELSLDDFRRIEDSILRSEAFAPTTSLQGLEKRVHLPSGNSLGDELDDNLAMGSFILEDQESYLSQLDALLADPSAAQRQQPRSSDKAVDRERDMALRNPVSVYNWLRKHQPQVFLQDNETTSEKAVGRVSNSRSKKAGATKHEDDMYDEDGILPDKGSSSTRGKRKRDDEPYRPKGSNRSTKRKRDDASTGKRAKKSSISENVF